MPAEDALWDATIADIVVACIFLWGRVVLARNSEAIIVNLSGRGDKDIDSVRQRLES